MREELPFKLVEKNMEKETRDTAGAPHDPASTCLALQNRDDAQLAHELINSFANANLKPVPGKVWPVAVADRELVRKSEERIAEAVLCHCHKGMCQCRIEFAAGG